jgi:hypothetical protein
MIDMIRKFYAIMDPEAVADTALCLDTRRQLAALEEHMESKVVCHQFDKRWPLHRTMYASLGKRTDSQLD